MNINDQLGMLGLSAKEAKVYVTLLENGALLAGEISKKAHLNRSTTYVQLEGLIQKGLVSVSDEMKLKVYHPVSPERLVIFLEDNAKKQLELVEKAHSLLPELKALYKGEGPKPKVMFFDGVEGIKSAYESTLASTESIKAFASIEDMHKLLSDYFPGYYEKRTSKDIKIQAIFPDTDEARKLMKYNKEHLRDAILVPNRDFSFSPEIMIYENKIVFLSLVEKFSLFIESQELASAMKQIFKLSWLGAKKLKKTKK